MIYSDVGIPSLRVMHSDDVIDRHRSIVHKKNVVTKLSYSAKAAFLFHEKADFLFRKKHT